MAQQQVPSIGRIVHYILPAGPKKGEHRAAIVVRVWSDECVNLRVFLDGSNDYAHEHLPHYNTVLSGDLWVTSANHAGGEKHEFGTWHWPEYVPAKESDPKGEGQ